MLNLTTMTDQQLLFQDEAMGLAGAIALVDTRHYPALGGCRFVTGDFTETSLQTCIGLANTMHYKAALHQLPLSGGKSILCIKDKTLKKPDIFHLYADLLNQLEGRYITAVDIGMGEAEMNQLAQLTPYVTGHTERGGDPSHYTAKGVRRGIEAAVRSQFKQTSLDGLHIAIQGVGKVGYHLLAELSQYDIKITIADTDPQQIKLCQDHFAVNVVAPDQIYQVDCDVFSPCAHGLIINSSTIASLQTQLIVGAANNQLADETCLDLLAQRDIFYAPDYLVNAGGLICCAHQYQANFDLANKVDAIYDLALSIFNSAQETNRSPYTVCQQLAKSVISQP